MTKDMASVLGVGVIGLGYWGPNLVRNFYKQDGCQVVEICDLNTGRLAKQQEIYPTVRTTTDASELIKSPDIDIVVICTPPATHYDLAVSALKNGKHIYMAKPITLDSGEALKLAELAEKKGKLLHVDHTFVYTPAVRKLKEILDDPDFGPLNYIDSVRINLGLFQQDTNVVWDLAPHDLSILDYLVGRSPHTVVAHTNAPLVNGHEHLAYVSMHYDQGLIANMHLNWLSPVKVRQIIFGGTRKMIIFDDMQNTEKVKVFSKGVEVQHSSEETHADMVQYRIGDIYSPFVENHEALDIECKEFLEAVVSNGTTPTSGISGYNIVLLVEAINKSMRSGGIPIEIK